MYLANLQGADLQQAELQGANLTNAKLQGANLTNAELQGADLEDAEFQGADLSLAKLQGADLRGAELQGAELQYAGVWLASVPDLELKSRGVAALEMSPLTAEDKANLIGRLETEVTDAELLKTLLHGLNPILQSDPETWKHEEYWSRIKQTHEPAPDETGEFLARMACDDSEGYIAIAMAQRITSGAAADYAKQLAKALLSEACQGAQALTAEKRVQLEALGSAPE